MTSLISTTVLPDGSLRLHLDVDQVHDLAWTLTDCLFGYLDDTDVQRYTGFSAPDAQATIDRFRQQAHPSGNAVLSISDQRIFHGLLSFVSTHNVYSHRLSADVLHELLDVLSPRS